ncbi:hypothetical protein MTO96_031412 [Rhipicephalus appendiculatus]
MADSEDGAEREVTVGALPAAGQVVVAGPVNILFVVLDIEVHGDEVVALQVGGDVSYLWQGGGPAGGRLTRRLSVDWSTGG